MSSSLEEQRCRRSGKGRAHCLVSRREAAVKQAERAISRQGKIFLFREEAVGNPGVNSFRRSLQN